ncbi:mechanosensitive ion channel [Epilithonimonas ginsengisoli]|uniref:Mechanosensitive ion channel n=1 Tax=Epilithonimonas ginsengisoli TaxID=1245592 RepID=A0ABU4JIK6_9FLAO|nr:MULTISPECIES: mechanosensitive ion channel domain-containing protein [Chryseobacterium group]MBV6879068.1 mechanosensitive ion channel family protein [Epilithonimonas sp. FP105]MDW8549503.1 mechanosensitive ion channel [Epilithonimonas ginsengisoli]OAH74367.1 mechanosensitive ion channel protein MscS [Chryseobacterium sp. FP211-J200]
MEYLHTVYAVLKRWYISFAELTPRLIVGILVFLFFLMTSTYLSRWSVKLFHKLFPKTKNESVVTLISVFKFLIILMGAFISLEIMGFSGFFIKFLGSLGVAGVIAGVALKDLVSSMFSGMLVGVDKAFKIGDYVTIGGNSGTVQDIGLLTTKMITDDGKKVYIPNQIIFNAPFFNVTASPQRRIILDFEIPVGEDIQKTKAAILDEIKTLAHVDKTDATEVLFTNVKQGVFNLQVKFWLEKGNNFSQLKSGAIMQINERLVKEGVSLVTPTSINVTTSQEAAKEQVNHDDKV